MLKPLTKTRHENRSAVKAWLRPAALIIALTIAAYIPAMQGGFIWDDDDYVTNNATLRSLDGLRRIWLDVGATPQYYPLVFTSFWIEHRLWGFEATGYHIVNVLLHSINAVLVWIVLRRLALPPAGAWLAAAVFALHPVHVESVAWITERKNVLSGLFYLGSLLAYLRFRPLAPNSSDDKSRWPYYALSLVLFLAALLSKTVTCTLPAAIMLLLWWKRDRFAIRDVLPLLPMFALGLAAGLMTALMEAQHVGAAGPDWDLSPAERLLIAGGAIWFYLGSLIWPSALTFIYPRWEISVSTWWQWLYPTGALVMSAALWGLRDRIGKGPLVAFLFFIGTILPALGFVNIYPMLFSFVADHFQYLASIGPLALIAMLAAKTTAHLPSPVRLGAAGALLATLGALTWQQARIYESPQTLWRDTLRKNPAAWIAHNNLSVEFQKQARHIEAAERARAALELRPGYPPAHNNLGLALQSLGRPLEAMQEFRNAIVSHRDLFQHHGQALDPQPEFALAHLNLANLLTMTGHSDEAESHYRQAIAAQPCLAQAHHNLAAFLLSAGRFDEAAAECQAALEIDSNDADTHGLLGVVYHQLGQRENAIAELREALRLSPNHAQAAAALADLKSR
jgi:tetratricopeptide (TPR) repeat protein